MVVTSQLIREERDSQEKDERKKGEERIRRERDGGKRERTSLDAESDRCYYFHTEIVSQLFSSISRQLLKRLLVSVSREKNSVQNIKNNLSPSLFSTGSQTC